MSKLLQLRGGTTAEHTSFTGAVREVTVDTDKDTLVIHDGSTAGGHVLPRTKADIDALNINADTLDGKQLATIESEYQAFANTAAANVVDSAPGTLDTLNELAAALGDDPNFATTVTNSIATKMPLSGGTFTGDITRGGTVISDGTISEAGNLTLDVAGDIILDADGGDVILKDGGNEFMSFFNGTIGRTGDLTLDASGDIILNADGGDIKLQDGSASIANFTFENSGDFAVINLNNNGDIIFRGNDGGADVNALSLDMSDAGTATFNNKIKVGGTTLTGGILTENGNFTIDVGGDISLDVDGAEIFLKDGGTQFASFYQNSNNFYIQSSVSDKDIIFQGNDGGTGFTALTLDMSAAGAATFNSYVNAPNFNTTSDATLKTNVETLSGSLDAVKSLRGVSFDWLENGGSEIGVIAQEVEAVLPDLVNTNDEGIKSVKYGNMVAVLIEAIKEQQAQIDALTAKLNS